MITLLVILAILAMIGLTVLAVAIGGIFAFGDVILAVVLIALIVKHFVKKYKKKQGQQWLYFLFRYICKRYYGKEGNAMKDKKKFLGIIGLSISAVITSVVTSWMTDREIKKQVNEALAEKNEQEES